MYLLAVNPPESANALELALVKGIVVLGDDPHTAVLLHQDPWTIGFDSNATTLHG